MIDDFPRILTLLRKERGMSQKHVAGQLGVAQALLSHYEKGKREPGLGFLVRAADFFDVSTDYLLGRSAITTGDRISESDLPETAGSERGVSDPSSLSVVLTKKLITNSIELIFTILVKARNIKLTQSVANYLTLAVYNSFRIAHRANSKNDDKMFGISQDFSPQITLAAMQLAEGAANKALSENKSIDDNADAITTIHIEEEYKKQGTALLSLVKSSETQIKKLL